MHGQVGRVVRIDRHPVRPDQHGASLGKAHGRQRREEGLTAGAEEDARGGEAPPRERVGSHLASPRQVHYAGRADEGV